MQAHPKRVPNQKISRTTGDREASLVDDLEMALVEAGLAKPSHSGSWPRTLTPRPISSICADARITIRKSAVRQHRGTWTENAQTTEVLGLAAKDYRYQVITGRAERLWLSHFPERRGGPLRGLPLRALPLSPLFALRYDRSHHVRRYQTQSSSGNCCGDRHRHRPRAAATRECGHSR